MFLNSLSLSLQITPVQYKSSFCGRFLGLALKNPKENYLLISKEKGNLYKEVNNSLSILPTNIVEIVPEDLKKAKLSKYSKLFFNDVYPGIVSQAVIGTLCAFGGILVAYRSGKIRVTPKFTRIMLGALMGYFVFSLITIFTGRPGGATGLLVAVAAVALATFFLVLDFDQIERTIAAGAPQEESWRMAFGLMVTIVWLYMEVLRLLSILRNGD